MASKENCEKKCWWTRAGSCLDYILPFCPETHKTKNKK